MNLSPQNKYFIYLMYHEQHIDVYLKLFSLIVILGKILNIDCAKLFDLIIFFLHFLVYGLYALESVGNENVAFFDN